MDKNIKNFFMENPFSILHFLCFMEFNRYIMGKSVYKLAKKINQYYV